MDVRPAAPGPPQVLCGTDEVSLVAPSQLAVSESAAACHAQLQLTAQNGEQAAVPVTIPALSQARVHTVSVAGLYCFANPAGRAIYITIDDGWTPSAEVLDLMHQTYLPITAFLIAEAAREHLSYWNAFVAAGGMIGDHTVSHPYLTKLTLGQATAQWGQARTALGRWLGQTPAVGRPPYGAFDRKVEVAAARAGLPALAGWSATMSGNRIETWNGKPLSPGEVVILHWVPGLGHQLTVLLAAIRALHLNPAPLTPASLLPESPPSSAPSAATDPAPRHAAAGRPAAPPGVYADRGWPRTAARHARRLPPEQAADETEFLARLGQFSLLNSAERAAVLAARTRAVREQLAHFTAMRDLATVSAGNAPALAPPGLAALLGHVRGGAGDGLGVRAQVLQVLVDPEQLRVMAGRNDPDQARPVILIRRIDPTSPTSLVNLISPIRTSGPEGSTHLGHGRDILGTRPCPGRSSRSGR